MITDLTLAQRKKIYERLQELVDIACVDGCSIYDGVGEQSKLATSRDYLESTYKFRFTQFRNPAEGWITNLTYAEQWIFALFVSEMILHGDIPE